MSGCKPRRGFLPSIIFDRTETETAEFEFGDKIFTRLDQRRVREVELVY